MKVFERADVHKMGIIRQLKVPATFAAAAELTVRNE
jgi:hypothetical protein